MSEQKGTPEPVQWVLAIDRAQGVIANFLGIAKVEYSSGDEARLDAAMTALDENMEKLQAWVYAQCGVK